VSRADSRTDHPPDVRPPARGSARPSAPLVRRSGVNTAALLREAEDAVGAVNRLHEYRDYLAQARAFKARNASEPARAGALEAQVLGHGRLALEDVRTLSRTALSVFGMLRSGGGLDPLLVACRRRAAGGLHARESWDAAVASDSVRGALRRAGVSDGVVLALGEAIRAVDARISAAGTRLLVDGSFGGRRLQGAVETAPRPATPRGVIDLLTQGRFEALAGAVAAGEPAYLDGVGAPPGDARPDELLLLGALGALREATRHVRKLEDAGLSVYEGGEPGTIAVIAAIALVVAIVAAVMIIADCPDNGEGEPDVDGGGPVCGIGVLLLVLSLATLALLKTSQSQGTSGTNLALGSAVVHGVARDLETVRS